MPHLPICPACEEPVADQPAQNWTSAYRGGAAPWWHLADNTPICPAQDGSHCQAVFVEDGLPADSETSTWLVAMSELFAIGGPYDPARLGSAITAAEHLHRWLFTATGPFSALLALRTPSDVAALVGHLHRTTRLLARVHAQTGSYLLEQARQTRFTGLDDDSDLQIEIVGEAHEAQALLYDAGVWSGDSAKMTGIALSHTRKIAALATATVTDTEQANDQGPAGDPATGRTASAGPARRSRPISLPRTWPSWSGRSSATAPASARS